MLDKNDGTCHVSRLRMAKERWACPCSDICMPVVLRGLTFFSDSVSCLLRGSEDSPHILMGFCRTRLHWYPLARALEFFPSDTTPVVAKPRSVDRVY